MQQSLQNLSVCMEKLERPPNPIASVASHIPPRIIANISYEAADHSSLLCDFIADLMFTISEIRFRGVHV